MKIQLIGFCALALYPMACGPNLASGQVQADQDLAQVVLPHRDKNVPKLLSKAITWPARSEARTKAIEELLAMDRDKLLSALAYQMTDREYNNCCLAFIRMYLPDGRLAPYLLRLVQEADGQTLMEAVKTAQAIPDARLLAPIFDHALESDYAEMVFYSDDHGRQVIRKPLFGEAAKAIHIITGGTVGIKDVPDEEKLRSIKQEKLPQWRQWWQANKANWPAAPPLPEKPKEPAPAGHDAQESPKNAPQPGKATEGGVWRSPEDRDADIWRLLSRAVAPAKPEITGAAAQELLAMDRERVLAALGRFVQRKDRARAVMGFVGTYFMDKQAVPLVAEALARSDGPALRQAVLIARLMPDPAFLGPLIGHALDSNYRAMAYGPLSHGTVDESISLFAEATDTLHVITKGKSGLRPVSAREETKEKKEALIAQWREWWRANKDTWQTDPPAAEKPKENPSPAKNAPEKGASEETQPPPKTDPPRQSPASEKGSPPADPKPPA